MRVKLADCLIAEIMIQRWTAVGGMDAKPEVWTRYEFVFSLCCNNAFASAREIPDECVYACIFCGVMSSYDSALCKECTPRVL